MDDLEMKKVAKSIGAAVTRAYHITYERTNRVSVETREFENIAMAAADGFEKTYAELLEQAEKFTYTIKVLTENNFPTALRKLQQGIAWIREHKEENVDKDFMGNYMYGYSLDIFKSEVAIARKRLKLLRSNLQICFKYLLIL